jgi:co-chaperonin GroES (HSP10)
MINPSGITPIFDRVLLLPLEVVEKTDWGFQLSTEETSEREQMANTTGQIVALGEEVPEGIVSVGDKVIFAKYAGLLYIGKDGKSYRMVNYDDLTGKLDPDMNLVDPHLTKGIKK